MLIKIDVRETSLHIECLKMISNYENIKIVLESLPIGDVIICNDDGEEIVIIERKTLYDLASSIKDGRYNEQGYRLNGSIVSNHNIFYLVEGVLKYYNPNKGRLERKSLLSSFISISYYKGFSIHRTDDTTESAEWIITYANKLQKEKKKQPYYNSTINSTTDKINSNSQYDYVNVVSKVKKDNITKGNIGAIMLMQIPSVSSAIAITIMEKYTNIYNLIIEMEQNPNVLESIKITQNNKTRKISKPTIANIYNFLIPDSTPSITVDV
jgi:ERCC4-type nuclease